jgi:hypothetical protein
MKRSFSAAGKFPIRSGMETDGPMAMEMNSGLRMAK